MDLEIHAGDSVGLVGESGSGKSSLGRALLRLNDYSAGSVVFDGTDLGSLSRQQMRSLRRRMQLVFQDPYSSLNPRMRVQALLEEPLAIHGIVPRAERADRVRQLLELVSLNPEQASRFPHEFSGGQRQRIGIAQALAVEPEFLVCDEPISALDVSVQAQIINLLMDLRDQLDLTFLFIGHDLDAVRRLCDRVFVMYLGKIVESGTTESVYQNPRHPYTRALLSSSPKPDPVEERTRQRILLTGDLPSPDNIPSGCRFHGRCWLYEQLARPARCRTEEPAAARIDESHTAACHFTDHLDRPGPPNE
ncbi:ATP-binding cassette domain-containing protein [Dactylosporangium fulvum]|uniref:ATP-binding cassette domain-containing protein n=1 Tax=Dactylosporangium fulvum TaxID=53359 RepID=A0ABY5W9T0_9ACTN|nr:oligopeptide/dipeptide ABC transporter ATP-binding protein [Dactylosporangium fulvum]UWP86800.1 ATP-binding cassette domain-containing protein [Dactylosporangium fulvum]